MPRALPYIPKGVRIAAGSSAAAAAVVAMLLQSLPQEEGRYMQAYRDPIGIPTICDGWTRGVRMGDLAMPSECDMLTQQGIQEAWEIFEANVPARVRAGLPDKTVAAFIDFIYNVGPGIPGKRDGFVWLKNGKQSTMLRALKAGNVPAACNQLPLWNKADGMVLRGLQLRRARGLAKCMEDL